jgi:hypothetical protein
MQQRQACLSLFCVVMCSAAVRSRHPCAQPMDGRAKPVLKGAGAAKWQRTLLTDGLLRSHAQVHHEIRRASGAGEGTDPDTEQGAAAGDRTPEGRDVEEPLLQGGRPQAWGPIARLKAAAKRLKRRMRVLYYASIVRPLTLALTYMAPQPVHGSRSACDQPR